MESNRSNFFTPPGFIMKVFSYPVLIGLFVLLSFTGCNQGNYITVKHVKPVNHNRYYNRKKDKKKKRVKYVKVKILKRSPKTASAPSKKTKKLPPAEKQDTVQYESDTTGFIP